MKDRRIKFEKIQNVRDLGGLETVGGHVIAPGLLLRSANLSSATEEDCKKLEENHHLALIVDLRTSLERKERPDVKVKGAEYAAIPVFDERVVGISHEKSSRDDSDDMEHSHAKSSRDNSEDMEHFNEKSSRDDSDDIVHSHGNEKKGQQNSQIPDMEMLYRMIVTEQNCRKNLGMAVRTIMEHDFSRGSVLWHCTEGKDRCGLVSAMLLSALGVDRELIMEDYLLTNEVNGPKAELYYEQMILMRKSEREAEAVKNAFLAKETYLRAAFEAIDREYQEMDQYLTDGLGIPAEVIVAFREKVREKTEF